MSVTFTFILDDPTENQDPQETIKCYESDDGSTGWTEIDEVYVGALSTVDETTTYICAPADSTKYHILSPVSAGLVEYPLSIQKIIPPVSTNANVFTAYVNIIEIDGDKNVDVPLKVKSIKTTIKSIGGSIVVGNEETATDSNGFASLTVVADIGDVGFEIGNSSIVFDTTGLGGSAVDLSSHF